MQMLFWELFCRRESKNSVLLPTIREQAAERAPTGFLALVTGGPKDTKQLEIVPGHRLCIKEYIPG